MYYFVPLLQHLRNIFPELESSKKQAEADKKAIDDLVRERDILNKVRQYVHTLYLS